MEKDSENQDTKQKILDVAEELFFEKGYDGSRVDEIVKIANVNKSSLYYYFEGKEDVLTSLLEKSASDIYQKKAELRLEV